MLLSTVVKMVSGLQGIEEHLIAAWFVLSYLGLGWVILFRRPIRAAWAVLLGLSVGCSTFLMVGVARSKPIPIRGPGRPPQAR